MMTCFAPTELRLYVHLASYPGSFFCYPMRESQNSCQASTKALNPHFLVLWFAIILVVVIVATN